MRADAELLARMYNEVQTANVDTTGAANDEALFQLMSMVIQSGIPIVLTGAGDTILAVENLPMRVDISTPAGQQQVRDYLRTSATPPKCGASAGSPGSRSRACCSPSWWASRS
jgi:hypothetical protein